MQKPDLLCFALSVGCSCCGGELLGLRDSSLHLPSASLPNCSSVLLAKLCLVRELSARFYASEISKFMVMPVLF
ncbi:hypothetical protein SLEP1_g43835 [Rubroshorea leprosula]|uniref:Secreted protein n=1 Tax=Rubroshorea leprosula TaxID=152421 RepID=A0AAV5LF33_9ROSI|nr:hypothetical protein SLEP1_g43835 [Rubroshorea leprosula]